MKQILLTLLMFSCCYACNKDNSTLLLPKHKEKPNIEYNVLDIALTPHKGFGFKTSNFSTKYQRAVTGGEYVLICSYIDLFFRLGTIYDYWLETFYGYIPFIAIDESLTNGREAYYDPVENTIYFRPDKITGINLKHEYIHSIQRNVCAYPMTISNGDVRNVEYEVFVAMDILQCYENDGILDPQKNKIYGTPQGKQGEYISFIQQFISKASTLTEEEIGQKFNEWIKDWPYYKNEASRPNFTPGLLRYLRRLFIKINNNQH